MGKATSDWPTGNILRETVSDAGLHAQSDPLQSRGWLETNPRSVFSEGLAIDYKWFDKYDITPRYEFGFGLR
jgi:beta-glucosidase